MAITNVKVSSDGLGRADSTALHTAEATFSFAHDRSIFLKNFLPQVLKCTFLQFLNRYLLNKVS